MSFARLLTHLFAVPAALKRRLPAATLAAVESAIGQAERGHRGEIRFAVETTLDTHALLRGHTARERAIDVFSQLRVWDTEENNGVLIYLLLAERNIEIVADRGIHARVGDSEWARICRTMEQELARGESEQALVHGIEQVARVLARHFPPRRGDRNELPDKPVVL